MLCGFCFFKKKKKRSRDISIDFTILKFALHNKIINKTRATKNQENFAHPFLKTSAVPLESSIKISGGLNPKELGSF